MADQAFGPYQGVVNSVHDGDTYNVTLTIETDLGFGFAIKGVVTLNCRAYGINAPELSTPEGKIARDFAQSLLTPGMQVSVLSYGWDKYGGRFDGTTTLPDGRSFEEAMVSNGHAVHRTY